MFNILVAEDDASACRLMCEVLRQAGYQQIGRAHV